MANLYHKGMITDKRDIVERMAKARLCVRLMVEYECCDTLPPNVVTAAENYTRLLSECEAARFALDKAIWPNGFKPFDT